MQDIITYLREYSDKTHHPRKDIAFALLVKHCPDLELVLARLGHEHRVIANVGEALACISTTRPSPLRASAATWSSHA